ncbi:hypothetical protein DSL72_007111 [Monilinia vaccinii-corymbosi]|uniref:Uncharacterized protein n=1 Tax=Monilinia vaccinii-corymbosi TaxID=61207 RepID=A0A8A3PM14_9HELO|nr:hypothetical protein DSL72_007111 [Monilinia vaccinii-corymbosi]
MMLYKGQEVRRRLNPSLIGPKLENKNPRKRASAIYPRIRIFDFPQNNISSQVQTPNGKLFKIHTNPSFGIALRCHTAYSKEYLNLRQPRGYEQNNGVLLPLYLSNTSRPSTLQIHLRNRSGGVEELFGSVTEDAKTTLWVWTKKPLLDLIKLKITLLSFGKLRQEPATSSGVEPSPPQLSISRPPPPHYCPPSSSWASSGGSGDRRSE